MNSKIGVLKEIKSNESRVALTPSGCYQLTSKGLTVFVESSAGLAAGFTDHDYLAQGASICLTPEEVAKNSHLLLHVKEPQASELGLFKPHHTLFTYLHLASNLDLAKALAKTGVKAYAYEAVTNGAVLPLLLPMSEVAGRMAIQEGCKYLEAHYGGKGKLLSGVPGVAPANVLILGAGVVGFNAALLASSLGAKVTVMDLDINKLRNLNNLLPTVTTVACSDVAIRSILPTVDLIIGAVMLPNAKTPRLIRKEHLPLMERGTVLVDVSIDQGGCFETSKATSHKDPIYAVDGIIHYCVANMPGAVPRTSTLALTNATLPYIERLALNKDLSNQDLTNALMLENGNIINPIIQALL